MTNRNMVREAAREASAPQPNRQPGPPMPADEDGARPTTDLEPVDSPQPNASLKREPPSPGRPGLATER